MARFPAVRRDLSVIVDEEVTWQLLAEAIGRVDQPDRVGLDYASTYRGEQIATGRKSVTLTLTYRSPEGTLRSEDVDQNVAEVIAALTEAFVAELRT